jgi:ATP-binding cassette, subfamily B, bacterial PglK
MTIFNNIKQIQKIIPATRKKAFRRLFAASFAFNIFDLVSVAYLVPVLLLLLDKQQLDTLLSRFAISVDLSNQENILFIVFALVILYIVKNVLQVRFNKRLQQFLFGMAHDLSVETLRGFLHGDYLAFQRQDKGSLIRNTVTAARDFSVSVVGSLFILVSESLTFAVILVALLCFYFKLTLIAFLVVSVFALLIYKLKRFEARLISDTYQNVSADANAEMLNIADGYLEIKSAGNSNAFLARFEQHNAKLNRVTAMLNAASGNYQKYMEIFLVCGIGGLVLYTLLASSNNNIVLVALLAALSIRMLPSLSKMMNALTLFNAHSYSIQLLADQKRPKTDRKTIAVFEGALELKNIGFAYRNDRPVFENLNLTIKRGQIIGIKGVTGVGKTTFLHIVAGLLAPDSGEILIDEKPVPSAHFFPFMGYVPQQPFLFNGTIRENITMLEPKQNVDDAYIAYLIENLFLSDTIASQPNGLDTIITHNTSKLSGGQKQRIALVRALYHKPKLLILDEATNQQNAEMEASVFAFIRTIASEQKMAVLTVSHHNSLAQFCDKLYELKNQQLQ